MKHKEDIYKKRRRAWSEYMAMMLVVIVVIFFFAIEIYSFMFPTLLVGKNFKCKHDKVEKSVVIDKTSTVPIAAEKLPAIEKSPMTFDQLESNISTVTVTTPVSDALMLETEAPLVKTVSSIKVANPLEKILTLSNEAKAWELHNTYKAYSAEDKDKLLIHAVEHNHANNLSLMLLNNYRFLQGLYQGDVNKLIATRKYDVVFILIEKNLIDIHKPNAYGYTILHEATAKGHKRLTSLIVSKGLDINTQAKDGASVLHYPTKLGFSITVSNLLKMGINPNLQATLKYNGLYWNKSTPLHIAAKRGDVKNVAELIRYKADISLKDGDGMTALQWAKKLKRRSVIKYIEAKMQKPEVIPIMIEPKTESNLSVQGNNTSLIEPDQSAVEILQIQETTDPLDVDMLSQVNAGGEVLP